MPKFQEHSNGEACRHFVCQKVRKSGRSVQKLETAGIIKKMNDSKRDKVYCAIEILNILEEPTKIMTDIYNN